MFTRKWFRKSTQVNRAAADPTASEPFEVKAQFTGIFQVNGPGSDAQKVFAVGCDGNSEFGDRGGFVAKLGESNLPALNIEYVYRNHWRLTGVPVGTTRDHPICCEFIGFYAEDRG